MDEVTERPQGTEEPIYTSAEDWPTDGEAQTLTLPSGAVVKVRPPAVVWLALTGRVPAHLVAIQKHHIADGNNWNPDELSKALDWLTAESFVSPKVSLVKTSDKKVRHISSLSERDKEVVVMALKLQQYIGVLG